MSQHDVALVLFLVALVAFALSAVTIGVHERVNLTAVGLFCVTLALFISGLNLV